MKHKNGLTSIGLLSFSNLPVTFNTFTADKAEMMPNEPSKIPASTTVSYLMQCMSVLYKVYSL